MQKIMKSIKIICLGALLSGVCSACYRIPTDDDYSLVPLTNNPSVTNEKDASWTPKMKY